MSNLIPNGHFGGEGRGGGYITTQMQPNVLFKIKSLFHGTWEGMEMISITLLLLIVVVMQLKS